ncbi:hypothetical protein DY000_02052318 [Brassica cretica]|uniref:Uncharacterized protein n=1 Tax=Brassica cretica TaxID=69181 RepID=A0ABQ7AH65_BRACR|nr:hypothetical protein DY000_02052318 [Brassica cretica]
MVMVDHLGLKVEPSKESFTFVDCSQRNSGGIVRDLEVQIGNPLVPVDFHVLEIKMNWKSSLLLGRAFLSTVGAVCNMQTNQLCLTLIDPHIHYDPIPVIKPHTSSSLIAACHCEAEYETEYSASIETHTPTSIDSQKSIDNHLEESIDSSPDDWENDYYNPTLAEERATEYQGICAEEDRNATSINITIPISIDTHHHQTNRKRASSDIAYRTTIHEPGADELHEGFTTEELLNLQERSDTYSLFAAACGKGNRFYNPFTRAKRPSIDNNASTSIDNCPKPPSIVSEKVKHNIDFLTSVEFGIFRDPEGYARAVDGHALQVSREFIADILQMANGAENLFMQQHNTPEHQQRVTDEFYDTTGEVDDRFKPKYQPHTRLSINISVPTSIDRRLKLGKRAYDRDGTRRFHWEEKDNYWVYRDDHGLARGVDGHIIHLSKDHIRNLLERASMDEYSYICLPEQARSFTHAKLVTEIYTKDEINEMLYGICGAQEKNEDDFHIKLDGVYYPLNDSISWLTTCMEEMRQDIARMQTQRAAEATTLASIDINISTSLTMTRHNQIR